MIQEAQKLIDQTGVDEDSWFTVDRDGCDGLVASGWTELLTESGDTGIIIVDVNDPNIWDDDKMDNAKRRVLASWNALAGIPIEAIESGVVAELKQYVVTFCGPWAVQYSRDFGLPEGHLHPTHYDILEKCGARMDDFTRAKLEASK